MKYTLNSGFQDEIDADAAGIAEVTVAANRSE